MVDQTKVAGVLKAVGVIQHIFMQRVVDNVVRAQAEAGKQLFGLYRPISYLSHSLTTAPSLGCACCAQRFALHDHGYVHKILIII